jgi:hypothetical protein
MANFAHAPHQAQAVNLDRVDTIKLGISGNSFHIQFMTQVVIQGLPEKSILAQWYFKTEEEMDEVLMKILAKHGSRF